MSMAACPVSSMGPLRQSQWLVIVDRRLDEPVVRVSLLTLVKSTMERSILQNTRRQRGS